MKTESIRQQVTFRGATPHDTYECLIDSRRHTVVMGSKAKMSRKVGGKFEAGDGYITGRNLELVPDKLIVQEWRGDEDAWPRDHFSIARFRFTNVKGGTRLDFFQSGVPAAYVKMVADGWREYYWEPMKRFLAK
jgi:activator of HSP90 ATPase